jgi:hypothetical protein
VSIQGNWNADKPLQSKLLVSEGVLVNDDFTFAIEKYRFRPTEQQLRSYQLEDSYIQALIVKYNL